MDKYRSFAELSRAEKAGRDFRIRKRVKASDWAVIAPHGGGIEPGTSEIADAIAGRQHTFYAFEGRKRRGNGELHITSARFDEPHAVEIASKSARVITIHGEGSRKRVVFLGGGDGEARTRLQDLLERHGFVVERHGNPSLDGVARGNICNRGRQGAGIQIELSAGLRRYCFRSLTTAGRKVPTEVFTNLVRAIRIFLNPRPSEGRSRPP